ncbi:MAG: peptide-methionine (R)-S-oxide reductase [Pseudomonadota bacterium]
MPSLPRITRRSLVSSSAALAIAGPLQAASASRSAPFEYEITRTLPEWLERLSPDDFKVLRLSQTEPRHSSPLIQETRSGAYCCKGCDLPLYVSDWKVQLDIGWVFFRHGEENALLMAVDHGQSDMGTHEDTAKIEAHCRRCGSHIGHVLLVNGAVLHCVNGSSLQFEPAAS